MVIKYLRLVRLDIPLYLWQGDEDYSDVMNDPAFLQQVLENLPGVDPQDEAIQSAVSSMTKDGGKKDDKKDGK